jgi:hypothetical protein
MTIISISLASHPLNKTLNQIIIAILNILKDLFQTIKLEEIHGLIFEDLQLMFLNYEA